MRIVHATMLASVVTLFTTSLVATQLYKSVDQDGNIVYSDTPTPGAEQLKPPPLSTVESAPKPAAAEKSEAEAPEGGEGAPAKKPPTKYTTFEIAQPRNDDTIWDSTGSIPVALQLEPPLDVENGHSIWVYVDGSAVVRKSQSLVQPLSNIDRGTHKIRAEIRDEKRRTLKRTKNVTVHLKRPSAIPRGGP